ncbi:hypothetical protein DPMN_091193 [Dreissena polymorpha]|uniref:Uncharacterized protein n=1 Tax=Dreissena polymorpha TaxID=45954 RepID=A0A9D4KZ46_DREPO|nr:hypothetical protein DPMN_091193 [Dreissena polymorpha]
MKREDSSRTQPDKSDAKKTATGCKQQPTGTYINRLPETFVSEIQSRKPSK